ncbi:hypothetical protein B0H12DRAFT_1240046 [Mycena haematopus]|nr:hypothetical protein B0H12DRAFT_1240046 [Mycena haematopus]
MLAGILDADGKPLSGANAKYKIKTIPQGAATTIVAAFDPRIAGKPGAYLADCVEDNATVAPHCLDPVTAERLWILTEKLICKPATAKSQMDTSRCSNGVALSTNELTDMPDVFPVPETRYHTLFTTNEPPEDSESTFIRSVISKTATRLASLEDEIYKVTEKLKHLEDERASLSSHLMQHKAILSPLRRMPPELLSEIFSSTLPSLGETWQDRKHYMDHSSWVLSHVSSRWRTVSLSTPSLWSSIAINYNEPRITYPAAPVEAQLQRADKLKIHFYSFKEPDSHLQIQMFRLLSEHSERWEELSLGVTSDLFPLLAALHNRVPSLKRLWLQGEDESLTAAQSIDYFQSAPSLLDFGNQQLAILKLAQNVVEARLDNIPDDESWPISDEIFDLPHLRRMYVSHVKALSFLRAPALTGIALADLTEDGIDDELGFLESFVDRSACPLRRLSLIAVPAHATIKILEKFPFITELAIAIEASAVFRKEDPNVNELMSSLTLSRVTGSSLIAPHLHSLFFGCPETSCINYELYFEMLKSRWEAKSALQNAALATELFGPDPATLTGLYSLRREGLNISVVNGVEASTEISSWLYGTTW